MKAALTRCALLAASPAALCVTSGATAFAAPVNDEVLALVSEWNQIEAEINAELHDTADDDPRFARHKAIETALMDGAAPTSVGGVLAALSFARREIAPQLMLGARPPTAHEVFEEDPGNGLAVAMIDAAMRFLSEGAR